MKSLDDGPSVMSVMTVMTAGAAKLVEDDPRAGGQYMTAIKFVVAGESRDVPGWRATYPMDDPKNEPDLWINETGASETLWMKRDDHDPFEPKNGVCGWCGTEHPGTMSILTCLLPEDW